MRFLRSLLSTFVALARHLSDENAYHGYLRRTGRAHSKLEWHRFIDQRHRRKYGSPKCC
jgi:hypothetical protein